MSYPTEHAALANNLDNNRFVGAFTPPAYPEHIRVNGKADGSVQITTSRLLLEVPEHLVLALSDALVDLHETFAGRRSR